MKLIKNPQANLESNRFRFFKLGMIISCSLALLAFRWTTYELEEDQVYSPPIERETLITELAPVSFIEMAKPKKRRVVRNNMSIIKLVIELPKESKTLKLISLGQIQDQIGDGWEDEPGIIEPTFPSGPEGWMKAERTPYFDECAQPSNKKEESACTYATIKNFVQSNTRYPPVCRELGVEGTVWLTFVIDKNGDVVEIEEVNSPHSALTKAAISGLSKLPKLNPGTQRLNPVAVKLEIPVRFMLSR
ncbi:MAG: protein TonB [Flavobacteriales bacterium]|jgi:protein TonB